MATMGNYCKAYLISMFQKFPHWSEKPGVTLKPEATDSEESEEVQPLEPYLFLQENLVVTAGIFLDEDVVFDQITHEWEKFCREELQFEVPQELETPAASQETGAN